MSRIKWKEVGSQGKIPTFSLDDVLRFGKHKDETVRKVIKIDANYVDWCLENKIFKLDDLAELKLAHANRRSDNRDLIYEDGIDYWCWRDD